MLIGFGFLISCSDDDAVDDSYSSLIIGKWEFAKFGEYENGVGQMEPWVNLCSTKKDYLEFTSNQLKEFTYDENCVVETEISGYSINGKFLTSDDGNEVEIETLNSTTLRVKVEENYQGVHYKYISELKRL